MNPYISILIMMFVSAGFLITMLLLARFLGPKNATATKQLPFECGSVSVGSVRDQRFQVRFYLVAVLFILFDVEVVFLYPWALVLEAISWPGFYAMALFLFVLLVGLVYEWKQGILDWND